MTLNPRVGMYLSLAAALLLFAAGASAELTDMFDPNTAKKIVAAATFLGGLVSAANAVLHAIPSAPGKNAEFPLGPKS
jgi:hypothetical protein